MISIVRRFGAPVIDAGGKVAWRIRPKDAWVLARTVDPGNAVAASLQAVTLFTLGEDLRQMILEANVDEADVGSVQNGQRASFTVSAFPNRPYPALVDQIEQAAALRATNAERQRIRDIEEMALPGSEQITNEAKYDKPMSASDYAKAAMNNAKEQGAAWLNTMQQGANASGVNSVGSAPAPTGGEKPDEFMDAIKGLGKKQ